MKSGLFQYIWEIVTKLIADIFGGAEIATGTEILNVIV
jgi:hypothetical protein